jgi:hypothetical protein
MENQILELKVIDCYYNNYFKGYNVILMPAESRKIYLLAIYDEIPINTILQINTAYYNFTPVGFLFGEIITVKQRVFPNILSLQIIGSNPIIDKVKKRGYNINIDFVDTSTNEFFSMSGLHDSKTVIEPIMISYNLSQMGCTLKSFPTFKNGKYYIINKIVDNNEKKYIERFELNIELLFYIENIASVTSDMNSNNINALECALVIGDNYFGPGYILNYNNTYNLTQYTKTINSDKQLIVEQKIITKKDKLTVGKTIKINVFEYKLVKFNYKSGLYYFIILKNSTLKDVTYNYDESPYSTKILETFEYILNESNFKSIFTTWKDSDDVLLPPDVNYNFKSNYINDAFDGDPSAYWNID